MSILQQNWRKRQNSSCLEVRRVGGVGAGGGKRGEMAQTMYTHMNKIIKGKKRGREEIRKSNRENLIKVHYMHGNITKKSLCKINIQ
jgi:hypothetical protein